MLGEAAFFTEVPQLEAVRSLTGACSAARCGGTQPPAPPRAAGRRAGLRRLSIAVSPRLHDLQPATHRTPSACRPARCSPISPAVCRVLVVGRAAYASLERSFPHSARLVLHNLKRKAEGVSLRALAGGGRLPKPCGRLLDCTPGGGE